MWKKVLVLVIEAVLVIIILSAALFLCREIGFAEGEETVWVLCDPDSYVCLRDNPRKSSLSFGGVTCGTMLQTDGQVNGGYIHLVNVPAEADTGWISSQFIVYDEPIPMCQSATVVSNGRLAVRKGIDGKVKTWLKPMDELTILFWTDEWCLTNYGYVKSMYLEFNGG